MAANNAIGHVLGLFLAPRRVDPIDKKAPSTSKITMIDVPSADINVSYKTVISKETDENSSFCSFGKSFFDSLTFLRSGSQVVGLGLTYHTCSDHYDGINIFAFNKTRSTPTPKDSFLTLNEAFKLLL